MYRYMESKHHAGIAAVVASLLVPWHAVSAEPQGPHEQEFVVTAYYSPLPHQCCYVLGSVEADRALNGEGKNAADGTPVFPGMAAAPASYAFGTRIVLPGLGAVTVHDRGSAITELSDGSHRLDLWVGEGEEGLARALTIGVQRIRGMMYPVGVLQPPERVALEALPAPVRVLRPYLLEEVSLLALQPEAGDRGLSVELLQQYLRDVGSYNGPLTGFFGSQTQESLAAFLRDLGLEEPADRLTQKSAAVLVAAVRRRYAEGPLPTAVEEGSPVHIVMQAKRTLRFLGVYRGRTNGIYDEGFRRAVLAFQKAEGIVMGDAEPGAGRIGPRTRERLATHWRSKHIVALADRILDVHRVEIALRARGRLPEKFLVEGDRGPHVLRLQRLLAERGLFPRERLSGLFGEVTQGAVLQYQLSREIVKNAMDFGAGVAGPATLRSLAQEERAKALQLVRAEGWRALL